MGSPASISRFKIRFKPEMEKDNCLNWWYVYHLSSSFYLWYYVLLNWNYTQKIWELWRMMECFIGEQNVRFRWINEDNFKSYTTFKNESWSERRRSLDSSNLSFSILTFNSIKRERYKRTSDEKTSLSAVKNIRT